MKRFIQALFIIGLFTTQVIADNLNAKLIGVWKSQPESKDKFTCIFNKDASFKLTAIHKFLNLGTNGKYTLQSDHNKTLLHLYDLDFIFIRNSHYGGLVEFIDDNTLKLELKHSKRKEKVNYPQKFGKSTIIFFRQNG